MTPELDLRAPLGLFIDGAWTPAVAGGTMDVFCPATGDRIAVVAEATEPDVDRAVRAAHEAFESTWSTFTAEDRYHALMALADRIQAEGERLRIIEVVDSGSTVRHIGEDTDNAARFLRMYAGFARQLRGKSVNLHPNRLTYTVREPYGVVAQVLPFNRPLRFVAHAVGVTLAAGNTVVLKPSEYTPLSALEFADLTRDILPPGVINFVTGYGPACGSPLVNHELVKKVHFRGSAPTGRMVAVACAERAIPYTLELGGKNPFIVYPDADVAIAAKGAVAALNVGFQGQSCSSATRLFVHDELYDEFRDRLVAGFSTVKAGLPWDPATDMGAVVCERQYNRILEFIASGREQGARVLTGGRRVQDPALASGWFIEPTVFEVDDPGIRIVNEEIFGPVTTLMRWKDEADVIRLANSVEYGHCASVWTRDLTTAHRATRALDAGVVWVNEHLVRPDGMPFGVRKASGIGKEHAIEEIDEYSQEKSIMINLRSDGFTPVMS